MRPARQSPRHIPLTNVISRRDGRRWRHGDAAGDDHRVDRDDLPTRSSFPPRPCPRPLARPAVPRPCAPTGCPQRPSVRHRSTASGGPTVFRRLARASLLSVLALLLVASSAFAHECFNASRSDQGNTGAQHSANWFNLTLEMVLTRDLPRGDRRPAQPERPRLGPPGGCEPGHPVRLRHPQRQDARRQRQGRDGPGHREERRQRQGHRPRHRRLRRPALRDLHGGLADPVAPWAPRRSDAPAARRGVPVPAATDGDRRDQRRSPRVAS